MTQTPCHVPSDEERKLFADFIAETHKRELTSTDNFDKSVLTLSSAGLGLSLSFLKDFSDQHVVWPWVLYGSWILFVLATLSTMLSFLFSCKALEKGRQNAHRAYLEGDQDAFEGKNPWNDWTIRLNYASATTFILALTLTIIFVITNVKERTMAINTHASQIEHKGLTVPAMQRPVSAPATVPAQPAKPASATTNQQRLQ